MPKPKKGERKQEYVQRFMRSKEAVRDFPDPKQRYAVALSMWEQEMKKRRRGRKKK